MQDVSRMVFSSSTNGRQILVSTTAAVSANNIHTSIVGTSGSDEIWLWASNSDTSDLYVTICYGGTTNPDDMITMTVPTFDKINVLPGTPLNGGLIVKAFAGTPSNPGTANKLTISGYVNRIA